MNYRKIEFGISALFCMLCIYICFSDSYSGYNNYGYIPGRGKTGIAFFFANILPKLTMVFATYGAFLATNYFVIPRFWAQKKFVQAAGLTLAVWAIFSLIMVVAGSYLQDWTEFKLLTSAQANMEVFSHGLTMSTLMSVGFFLYVGIRELIRIAYNALQAKQGLPGRIAREFVVAFIGWLVLLGILKLTYYEHIRLIYNYGALFLFSTPYCIIIYFLNLYWLIPLYKKGELKNGWLYALSFFGTAVAGGVVLLAFLLQIDREAIWDFILLFWLMPTMLTAGLSWWVFWANEATYRKLTNLQTALGTSNANLQYLRSQINPHFLFNALNTLYGTALMEKAEKTGEGIQKLGDMMRFMLHENNQDKIPLSKEITYLHNYIDLQNMRLALSPDLVIDLQIETILGGYEIAPMLLIPFIENAYKHGISLKEKSWINGSLSMQDNVLHLDIHNSIHPVNLNDPEREQSGTGLENVKQRLQLVYPDRHELMIRQNAKEFFIHLSLTLGSVKPTAE